MSSHVTLVAADGTRATERVRERLMKLPVQRNALTQRLNATEDVIGKASNMLLRYLDLLEKSGAIYAASNDELKRRLLLAFFAQTLIDDDGHQAEAKIQRRELVGCMNESTM